MNWVWNNKGALATTAVVAKFIQNPQPFIDGTVKVVDVGTEKLVRPFAGAVVRGVMQNVHWTTILIASIAFLVVSLGVFKFMRTRKRSP